VLGVSKICRGEGKAKKKCLDVRRKRGRKIEGGTGESCHPVSTHILLLC
jgi:hypothetical protein